MEPMQILPCKKFYKVNVDDFTEYETTQHISQISKIWHVDITQKSSGGSMLCRVETFCREHADSIMQQSEKDLWKWLALINDDVTFVFNQYGEPAHIVNEEALHKKVREISQIVRDIYKGDLIENLLNSIEDLYNDPFRLLQEINQYKQYGLLTVGLYNNELNIFERGNTLNFKEEAINAEVREYFTYKGQEEGIKSFSMEGKVKNPLNLPRIDSYCGEFGFDTEACAIKNAKVEIAYTGEKYSKKRIYKLQALSAKDMEYI
jgi:hypothetical protein